jgi:hypothetical protein
MADNGWDAARIAKELAQNRRFGGHLSYQELWERVVGDKPVKFLNRRFDPTKPDLNLSPRSIRKGRQIVFDKVLSAKKLVEQGLPVTDLEIDGLLVSVNQGSDQSNKRYSAWCYNLLPVAVVSLKHGYAVMKDNSEHNRWDSVSGDLSIGSIKDILFWVDQVKPVATPVSP